MAGTDIGAVQAEAPTDIGAVQEEAAAGGLEIEIVMHHYKMLKE